MISMIACKCIIWILWFYNFMLKSEGNFIQSWSVCTFNWSSLSLSVSFSTLMYVFDSLTIKRFRIVIKDIKLTCNMTFKAQYLLHKYNYVLLKWVERVNWKHKRLAQRIQTKVLIFIQYQLLLNFKIFKPKKQKRSKFTCMLIHDHYSIWSFGR